MTKQVYCIYDNAVGVFLQPFFCNAKGEAVRGFIDEVNNPQSPLNRHYKDFTLFRVASFDENNAQFYQLGEPERVMSGIEVIGAAARGEAVQ